MTLRDIGRRFMTTRSCKNKIRYFTDFLAALPRNPSAALWFRSYGTRNVEESIERWMTSTTNSPRYTFRQSPTQGTMRRPVTVVHQPNRTIAIGMASTPPRTVTRRSRRVPNLSRLFKWIGPMTMRRSTARRAPRRM